MIPKRKFGIKIFILLVYFAMPFPVAAQSGSLKEILDIPLAELMEMEVVTPTRKPQTLSKAPGTIIVITKQQIEERGYVNLADLLEDQSGVDVQRNTQGIYTKAVIRGFNGNENFIVMQNGVRISSPTGENIPFQDNFPLFHARQVEILFGPASALYGADAFVGVINIITEEAESIDGVEVLSSIATDDYFYNYLKFGKRVTEKLDFTFGGHWHTSQNPDLSKSYERAFQNTDLLNSDGTVFRTAEDRKSFVAPTDSYSFYSKLDFNKQFTLGVNQSFFKIPTPTGLKPSQTAFEKDAALLTKIGTYYGKFEHEFTKNLSTESLINYSKYELLPDSKFTNFGPTFVAFKYAKGERFRISQQINYKKFENHELLGGIVFEDFDSIPLTPDLPEKYNTDLGPDEQGLFFPNTENSIPIKIFNLDWQNYASYLQVTSSWTSGISSVIGIRFDHNTRFGDSVNPCVGLIIKPELSTVYKLHYGKAFLQPSAERAFNLFGSFTGEKNAEGEFISEFFQLPNPDLKPEKMKTIGFNVIHNVTPNFILNLAGFYSKVDNARTGVFKNETSDFIPGTEILSFRQYENSGKKIAFGGHIQTDYQMFFENMNIKFWGSYSWTDGHEEFSDGGTGPLGITAKHKIKRGITFRAGNYFITPKVNWIGPTSSFSSTSPDKVSSYALVNLHAGANKIYRKLSAFLTVRNLLDNRYFNATSSRGSFISSPQDPRRIFVGLRYKF